MSWYYCENCEKNVCTVDGRCPFCDKRELSLASRETKNIRRWNKAEQEFLEENE